jgi:hypothetical protein
MRNSSFIGSQRSGLMRVSRDSPLSKGMTKKTHDPILADMVDLDDALVLNGGGGPRLAQEALTG